MKKILGARIKNKRRQRGTALLEFALVAPCLVMMFGIALSIGLASTRAMTVSALTRNVLRLTIQGVDFSAASAQGLENQKLVSKMARGLGMATSATNFTPNPTGKALVVLSKVVKVDNFQCASGISGWNGQPSTCPNHGQYVLTYRLRIGNVTQWTSRIGNPVTAPDPDGYYSDSVIATNTGVRVPTFSSILTLNGGKEAYMVEVFADNADYNLFRRFSAMPYIYKRYVS